MTEILVNTALFLLGLFAASFTPWAARRAGKNTSAIRQGVFGALVLDLYLFSLNETIHESGLLYGVSFSMIPLAVGAVVFYCIRKAGRKE